MKLYRAFRSWLARRRHRAALERPQFPMAITPLKARWPETHALDVKVERITQTSKRAIPAYLKPELTVLRGGKRNLEWRG